MPILFYGMRSHCGRDTSSFLCESFWETILMRWDISQDLKFLPSTRTNSILAAEGLQQTSHFISQFNRFSSWRKACRKLDDDVDSCNFWTRQLSLFLVAPRPYDQSIRATKSYPRRGWWAWYNIMVSIPDNFWFLLFIAPPPSAPPPSTAPPSWDPDADKPKPVSYRQRKHLLHLTCFFLR